MGNNENQENYSDDSFWEKVKKYARVAGKSVLDPALRMYYSAQDPDTPTWAKSIIYPALLYFVNPIDAIPDMTPVVGFSDDLGALVFALCTVAAHIKEEHKQKADEKLSEWFD